MKFFPAIFCIFISVTINCQENKPSKTIFTLIPFDFSEKDSLIGCQVIERYRKLTIYINNLVSNDIQDDEIKYSTRIAIERLLSSSDGSGEKFGIQDYSIEGKSNFYYNQDGYLDKLIELKNNLDAYEKIFWGNNCFKPESSYSNEKKEESYYTPIVGGSFNFLESTKKSSRESSNIRGKDSTIISFDKIDAEKSIRVRLMKILKPDVEYNEYIDAYKDLSEKLRKLRYKNDSISLINIKELKTQIAELESQFASYEIRFIRVSEEILPSINKKIKDYKKQQKNAHVQG